MTRPNAPKPKLRFPEFRDGPDWKERPLEEVGDFVDERISVSAFNRTDYVSTENLLPDFGGFALPSSFPAGGTVVRYQAHDILAANIRPYLKKIWLADRNGGASNDVIVIRAKEAVGALYLSHALKNDRFIAYVMSGAKGLKMPRGDLALIREYPVPTSSPAEQQKIAACLSTLDELIGAESQKLDALKAHKKGLMQQLFPREGETLPRLRFPEFQSAPEWNVKKLEKIGRVIRGASPRPKGDPRYYGGPVPRLMVQDVTRDGKWVTPQIDSLTEEGAKLSRPCPAGTLTIVCSGAVGIVSFLAVDACIHDGFLALVDIDESLVTKDFLYHRLSTLREQFERGATHGGVFTNLTTTGVDQLEIACPLPAEQQRIATCLGSLDDLIAAQGDKLEALQAHKQGLMQQLFPSPAEPDA